MTRFKVSNDGYSQVNSELLPEDTNIFHSIFDYGEGCSNVIFSDFIVDCVMHESQTMTSDPFFTETPINLNHRDDSHIGSKTLNWAIDCLPFCFSTNSGVRGIDIR